MRTNRRRLAGSTLVEHMAATAITAILMTIAAPSYTEYVRRGWIVDATNTLTTYAARLDSSFDSDGNYGVAACSVAAPAATVEWSFSCALQLSGQGFLVTATGQGRAAGLAYTLNHGGGRITTAYPGAMSARACWLVRGNEC